MAIHTIFTWLLWKNIRRFMNKAVILCYVSIILDMCYRKLEEILMKLNLKFLILNTGQITSNDMIIWCMCIPLSFIISLPCLYTYIYLKILMLIHSLYIFTASIDCTFLFHFCFKSFNVQFQILTVSSQPWAIWFTIHWLKCFYWQFYY